MLILVAEYAFVFLLLVGSNNDDAPHLRQMEPEDHKIYSLAACTGRCVQAELRQQQQQQKLPTHSDKSHFEHCTDHCRNATPDSTEDGDNMRKIYENLRLNLICRDDSSLTFRVDMVSLTAEAVKSNANSNMATTARASAYLWDKQEIAANSAADTTIYFVRVHVAKDADKVDVYLSDDNFFTIKDLQQNTTYSVNVVAVHPNNEYSVIAKEQEYTTLRRGYTPSMVTEIQVPDFYADEATDMHLMAKLTWQPSADMTCHYNIICFSPESEEYDLTPLEIRNPRQLYTYNLENLTFSSSYRVGIRAINSNNAKKESDLFWKSFEAPSCVEWFNYNFSVCAPLRPLGLEVEQIFVAENEFGLNISWQQPQHFPDYYTIRVLDLDVNGKMFLYNVSKQTTTLYIPDITLHGIMYEVHLTAYTPGGNATALVTDMTKMMVVVPDKNHIVKLIAAILAPIFCIAILSLTTFIVCHRRAKLKRYQERCKYFEELEKKAPIDPKATFDFPTKTLPLLTSPEDLTQFQLDLEEKIFFNDAMEIERGDIVLHEVLGEGAFGLVRRGTYNDDKLGPREVAAKMLKDQPSVDDVRAFRREIEVMKSVERHPNIVGILGHCTKRYNEMLLLTEYCSFGNLLDFLRDEWKYLYDMNLKCNGKKVPPHVPNRMMQQSQKQPQMQPLNCHNNNSNSSHSGHKTNSVFSIEASLIEKLKLKYKSLNTNQTQSNTRHTTAASSPPTSAADNKSYGYDEICTNACKCQVNVLIKDMEAGVTSCEVEQLAELVLQQQQQQGKTSCGDISDTSDSHAKAAATAAAATTIEVKSCDCRQKLLLARKNKRNAAATAASAAVPLLVENSTYFKSAAGPQQQQHQQQHELQQRATTTRTSGGDNINCDVWTTSFKRVPLSAADLFDIAKQVAVGMEFLAKNKVVHRDLAARNVLVAPDRTIKIADFGLSRDVYQENIYKKTGNGKLPIKWLALESMTHQVYTTQSDVWSYGILLYEIVTLGGTPYPSIPTNRLLHLLKTGYRMERPKNCGQDFYNLMHSCWHVNPGERPNFTEVIKILENLLIDAPQQQIESVLSVPKAQKLEEVNSDDSYLKPL